MPIESTLEASLIEREAEVLRQIAHGLTDEQIVEALKIDYGTILAYVQQIQRKLGVADRTQAVLWAVRNDLV